MTDGKEIVSIDFAYYFCRLMQFYSISYDATLNLPIVVFWSMNSNIDRIRAEQQLQQLHVLRVSQAEGKDAQEFVDGLTEQMASPTVTTITAHAKADDNAKAKLQGLIGKL